MEAIKRTENLAANLAMDSAVKKLTIGVSEFSEFPEDFLKIVVEHVAEEHVTPAQYAAAMLWHAVRGHDLSKIHFYQDGSGQTYNEDVLDEMLAQSDAESAVGLTTVCHSKEESNEHFRKIREKVDARRRCRQHVRGIEPREV
jgi:hypothetical protein